LKRLGVDEAVRSRIHKQGVVAQKIYSNDGKLNCGKKESPLEFLAVKT